MRNDMLPAAELLASLPRFDCVIDVRTPAEFALDHIPGAINLPVLSNDERIEVGTLYKQASPFAAKRRGAAMVARNIVQHLEGPLAAQPPDWRPLIYCWRGGQRSAAMTHILRQIGWRASQLESGYKGFRSQIVCALSRLPQQFRLVVLCGPTGSGKSALLQRLARHAQVLDLEALACHRGSVLGSLPDAEQPSQKAFETQIWHKLAGFNPQLPVYVESEGARIGRLRLPNALTEALRNGCCIAIDAPMRARVAFLVNEYQAWPKDPVGLAARLESLIGLHSKATLLEWHQLIDAALWPDFVQSMLEKHYDVAYQRSLKRDFARLAAAPRVTLETLNTDELERAVSLILALDEPAALRSISSDHATTEAELHMASPDQ